MKNIFITAVDTNSGKTFISGIVAKSLGFSYFKPIQSGSIEETDSEFVSKNFNVEVFKECTSYKEPFSPYTCGILNGQSIDIDEIKKPKNKNLIIEGAGGIFCPISKNFTILSLIKKFNDPCLIVFEDKLGCINHTLMTVEILKNHGVKILGLVANKYKDDMNSNIITEFCGIEVIGKIAFFDDINNIFKSKNVKDFIEELKQLI